VGNIIPLLSAALEEDADQIYQKAYNLILDKKWNEASELFQTLIEKYPKSSRVDGARFWQCYASEKRESSLEKAYACYESFIEKFPSSKWVNDAKANMLRIAQELVKQGKAEYKGYAEGMQANENDEIAMAALFALQGRGDERAFKAIISLYDKTTDIQRLRKMIYLIGSSDFPESKNKMLQIAKGDKHPELRAEALFWLGQQHPSKETVEFLKDRVKNDPDPEVQNKALFSLSQQIDEKSLPFFIDIVKNHKEKRLRLDAIFWIGQKAPADKAIQILQDLAFNDPDEEIQRRAMFSISQVSKPKALPILMKIAKDNSRPRLREEAIFWVAQEGNSPEIINFLKDLIYNDPNVQIQKKALFSLTQVHDAVTEEDLLKIVKTHKNLELRLDAIFWLGQQTQSPEMIKAIKEIVMQDNDPQLQERALFAIMQVNNNQGVPHIIEIAKKHKNLEIRKKAIFGLGQMKDADAMKALEEILYEKKQ
jgi:HEAT repeat protein